MNITHTEDLLRSLPQPIAIVGNGHPGRELGKVIDRHATVIRLNNHQLEGFKDLVGQRTTVRCTSGWQDIEARGNPVEISPFRAHDAESSHASDYAARSGTRLLTARTDIHGLLPGVAKPSTGIALLALCSSLGLEVSAFGFDGFRSGHYWTPGQSMKTTHSTHERDVILELPHVILYGQSYDYASLYDFCHTEHRGYDHNEGLALYREMGLKLTGERIIEFGAGNGELAAFIERQGNEVSAVEVSAVAFARIPVRRKILGDCLSLAQLEGKFDRLVSMDVLEHLTENDIRIVVREAARLAKSILVSVSTRPSGLLGPLGENLHLTVRSVEWWRELLSQHFHVHAVRGLEVGQLLIEGLRKDLAPAPASAAPRQPDHFELPAPYRARGRAEYYVDSAAKDDGVTWQPDVYPAAAEIARSLGCDTLIDIGCGHARKLAPLHPEFKIIGVDYGPNIEHCRRTYPFGTWLEADFEQVSLLPIPDRVLARSVVVCSDVIEHLVDPRNLLAELKAMLKAAPAVVLSTPDRVRTWGAGHLGPSPNPSHVREWSLEELRRLLEREGFRLATITHTRSNDARPELATILAIAVNPSHPGLQDSQFAQGDFAPPIQASPAAEPEAKPQDPRPLCANDHVVVAQECLARDDVPGFESHLEQALALEPEHRGSLLLLAQLQLQHGDPAEAARLFTLLLERNRTDQECLEGAVVAHLRRGDRTAVQRLLAA